MSECVVRMEMPNGCHDCKLRNMVGNCPIPMFDGQDEKKIWTLAECFQRPPWCPIICSLPKGMGGWWMRMRWQMMSGAYGTIKRLTELRQPPF